MPRITVQDGKLVLRDGKLGSGQGCCCGQCNPATCPNGTECVPPCVCVDGQCVPATGACCINGACDPTYTTQEECEACETVNNCTEYLFLEDPEQPCPEGWQGGGGFCQRNTNPASCQDCAGECWPQQVGPCGDWIPDSSTCDFQPLCEGQEFLYICGFPASIDTPGAGSCCGIPDGTRLTTPELSAGNPLQLTKDPFSNMYYISHPAWYGSLSVQCGRWRFSWADSSGNLCAIVNSTVDIDMGEISEEDCLPPGGSGTLYWTSLNCNTFQPISGSVEVTLSVSVSSSC